MKNNKLELQVRHSFVNVHKLDEENEIEIENVCHDVSIWLSIDQTKQLIEFLTKQIEESSNRFTKIK